MDRRLVLARRAALAVAVLLAIGIVLSLVASWTSYWRVADGLSSDLVAPNQRFVRVIVGETETCVTLQTVSSGATHETCYTTFISRRRRKSTITSVVTNENVTLDGICSDQQDLPTVARHLGIPDRLPMAKLWDHQCHGTHWVTVFAQLIAATAAAIMAAEMVYFFHTGAARAFTAMHPLVQLLFPSIPFILLSLVLVLWGVVVQEPGFQAGSSFSMALVSEFLFFLAFMAFAIRTVFLRRLDASSASSSSSLAFAKKAAYGSDSE
ncbi:hypothetical protein PINS_up015708 [Pythium insidiosum]|nr:hypothetical protein PINS_up015708 [Pythium insidiosum]